MLFFHAGHQVGGRGLQPDARPISRLPFLRSLISSVIAAHKTQYKQLSSGFLGTSFINRSLPDDDSLKVNTSFWFSCAQGGSENVSIAGSVYISVQGLALLSIKQIELYL